MQSVPGAKFHEGALARTHFFEEPQEDAVLAALGINLACVPLKILAPGVRTFACTLLGLFIPQLSDHRTLISLVISVSSRRPVAKQNPCRAAAKAIMPTRNKEILSDERNK
jgi:hypothetical protein